MDSIAPNNSPAVTWIGHASALVSFGDDRLLIDPLGRGRVRDLPKYRAVLITHSHVDHLNRWTLAKLDKDAQLIVPRGAKGIVADLGFSAVREVEPGDQLPFGPLEVECVGTRHDNGRWRKGDSPICTGYVITAHGVSVHHAGDVDMSDFAVFDDIGKRFDLNATLLPIGGMLPVWYYRRRRAALDRGVHIDPDTALAIFERLGAQTLVPIHWGTVNLRLGPPSAPKKRLIKVAADAEILDRLALLAHGQSLSFDPDPDGDGDGEGKREGEGEPTPIHHK